MQKWGRTGQNWIHLSEPSKIFNRYGPVRGLAHVGENPTVDSGKDRTVQGWLDDQPKEIIPERESHLCPTQSDHSLPWGLQGLNEKASDVQQLQTMMLVHWEG